MGRNFHMLQRFPGNVCVCSRWPFRFRTFDKDENVLWERDAWSAVHFKKLEFGIICGEMNMFV